jgi:hypothetical protein
MTITAGIHGFFVVLTRLREHCYEGSLCTYSTYTKTPTLTFVLDM